MKRRSVLGLIGANLGVILFGKPKLTSTNKNELLDPPNTINSTETKNTFKQIGSQNIDKKRMIYNSANVKCERTPEEKDEWDRIVNEINTKLKLTAEDSVVDALDHRICRIERGFTYKDPEYHANFVPNHVEKLLNQAADLLDRGIATRAQYDALGSKYFNLLLELKEYVELDKIHQEEIKAGYYEHNYEYALNMSNSEIGNAEGAGYLQVMVSELKNYFESIKNMYRAQRSRKAWSSGYPSWRVKKTDYANKKVAYSSDIPGEFSSWVHAKESELYLAEVDNSIKSAVYEGDLKVKTSSSDAANLKADAAKVKTKWIDKNREFRIRRTCLARNFQDIKAKVATEVDGVLNYGKRLESLKSRFDQDFSDAIARLRVVEKGLKIIYNHGTSDKLSTQIGNIDYFDDCLIWSRRQIQHLIKIKQRDQGLVWPVSLKGKMGEQEFSNGLGNGLWTITLDFDSFPKVSLLRLRGIACYVNMKDDYYPSNVWQLELTPPSSSTYVYPGGKQTVYSNDSIKPVFLGRASSRDSLLDSEIVGTSSLHNVSPIGKWGLELKGNLNGLDREKVIEDIQLDFHLSYQSI